MERFREEGNMEERDGGGRRQKVSREVFFFNLLIFA